MEFEAKTNKFAKDYTMGQITDMLQIRMEELQIGWACAAQNPSLLPENLKRGRGSNLASRANQHFENK